MERYKAATIAVDIVYVNRIPFLVTVSRHIKFGTGEMLESETAATVLDAIKQAKKAHAKRGFILTLADGQFEPLWLWQRSRPRKSRTRSRD
jgi:hypothetical protein